jgi:hypothetical protein
MSYYRRYEQLNENLFVKRENGKVVEIFEVKPDGGLPLRPRGTGNADYVTRTVFLSQEEYKNMLEDEEYFGNTVFYYMNCRDIFLPQP